MRILWRPMHLCYHLSIPTGSPHIIMLLLYSRKSLFFSSQQVLNVKTYGLHSYISDTISEVLLMLQFRCQFLPHLLQAPKMEVPVLFDSLVFAPTIYVSRERFWPVPVCSFPYNFCVVFRREQGSEIMIQYLIWYSSYAVWVKKKLMQTILG